MEGVLLKVKGGISQLLSGTSLYVKADLVPKKTIELVLGRNTVQIERVMSLSIDVPIVTNSESS